MLRQWRIGACVLALSVGTWLLGHTRERHCLRFCAKLCTIVLYFSIVQSNMGLCGFKAPCSIFVMRYACLFPHMGWSPFGKTGIAVVCTLCFLSFSSFPISGLLRCRQAGNCINNAIIFCGPHAICVNNIKPGVRLLLACVTCHFCGGNCLNSPGTALEGGGACLI